MYAYIFESNQYPENPIRRDIASEGGMEKGEDISLLFATGRYRPQQFNLKGSTAPSLLEPSFLYYSFFSLALPRRQLSLQWHKVQSSNVPESPLIHTVFRSNKPPVEQGVPDVSFLEGRGEGKARMSVGIV